jgi:hypothetical protein
MPPLVLGAPPFTLGPALPPDEVAPAMLVAPPPSAPAVPAAASSVVEGVSVLLLHAVCAEQGKEPNFSGHGVRTTSMAAPRMIHRSK